MLLECIDTALGFKIRCYPQFELRMNDIVYSCTSSAELSRGVPSIYYGDEQGFVGDGGHRDARQDMMPSLVPDYMNNDLIGTDASGTLDEPFPKQQVIGRVVAATRAAAMVTPRERLKSVARFQPDPTVAPRG